MSNQRGVMNDFNITSDDIIRSVSKLYMTQPRSFALMSMVHKQGLDYQIEGSMVNVTGTPIGAKIVNNPKFEMQRNDLLEIKSAINLAAGYAAGDTSIVVDDGAIFPKYALVYIPRTGEIMRVSSVSSNTLTVTRGEGNSTAAALLDNDDLIVMSSAYAENAVSGDVRFKPNTFDYNYTQIDREPYGNSRTTQGTATYSNTNKYEEAKKLALINMLRRNNGNMWLGGRDIDSTNNFRTTGGILSFVDSSNVYDVNQNLTRAEFEYFLRKYGLAYNSQKKTLFAGSKLIEKIQSFADDKLLYNSNDSINKFGMAVRTYFTSWGEVDIVYEAYFDEMTQGSVPLSSYGVVLDLENIKINYLNNGVLKSMDDIQENDRDGRKGEWLMEWGVEVNIPKAHAVIRNV